MDDDPGMRRVCARTLGHEGWDVVVVDGGKAALDCVAAPGAPFDCVVSDVNMPGMDGLTLLREIKTRRPNLPVMMVTAYGNDDRRRRASEWGAAEFITKPVNFDVLKARLRQLSVPSA